MTPLPFRELLGKLVGDLISAETHAAKASAEFLRDTGFIGIKEGGDDWGKLRFITFSYESQDADEEKTRTIRVPLLSLLPIPLQQIDQAEFEFFAKVDDVVKFDKELSTKYNLDAAAFGEFQPFLDLMCEIAPYATAGTTSQRAAAIPKVHVKLIMRQADLPAGLTSSLRRIEQTSGNTPK